MTEFKNPLSAVDIILEKEGKTLFVKRKYEPFKEFWALPGGIIEYGKETLEEATVRETKEETGLIVKVKDLKLIGVFSKPSRDPRGHVITHVYYANKFEGELKADDDAKDAQFLYSSNLKLAFDHDEILNSYHYRKFENSMSFYEHI